MLIGMILMRYAKLLSRVFSANECVGHLELVHLPLGPGHRGGWGCSPNIPGDIIRCCSMNLMASTVELDQITVIGRVCNVCS